MLLLLASSIASSSDHILGICGHPFFIERSKNIKCSMWSFQQCINIPFITFFLHFIWYSIFRRLLSVFTRWTNCFFNCRLRYRDFYFFLKKIKYMLTRRRTKISSQPLPYKRFLYMNNYFFKFLCLSNYFFCFIMILPSPFS
jgi:hypothetical protein